VEEIANAFADVMGGDDGGTTVRSASSACGSTSLGRAHILALGRLRPWLLLTRKSPSPQWAAGGAQCNSLGRFVNVLQWEMAYGIKA
jgi:hypothetical protein